MTPVSGRSLVVPTTINRASSVSAISSRAGTGRSITTMGSARIPARSAVGRRFQQHACTDLLQGGPVLLPLVPDGALGWSAAYTTTSRSPSAARKLDRLRRAPLARTRSRRSPRRCYPSVPTSSADGRPAATSGSRTRTPSARRTRHGRRDARTRARSARAGRTRRDHERQAHPEERLPE